MLSRSNEKDVIALIENEFGGKLDQSLAYLISRSPSERLAQLVEHCAGHINGSRPPELGRGLLRPEVRKTYGESIRGRIHWSAMESALSLLLYTHEVVVDNPFDLGYLSKESIEELRPFIGKIIRDLAEIRPLVQARIVKFAPLSRARHPVFSGIEKHNLGELVDHLMRDREVALLIGALAEESGRNDIEVYYDLTLDVVSSLRLAKSWLGGFTPLMHGYAELEILRSILGFLDDVAILGSRAHTVSKLSSLVVPSLKTATKELVAIRQSDHLFAEWRAAIQSAMRDVQDLSDRDERWVESAREILLDGLSPVKALVERNLKKSSFLAQTVSGTRSFTFAGLGATTGVAIAGGSPVGAVTGVAVTKTVELIAGYVSSLRARRQARAVLEVILAVEK